VYESWRRETAPRSGARLLKAGVTVARTADDLVRYHAKYIIIDGRELLLAFNFTYLDIDQSRSFGVITKNKRSFKKLPAIRDGHKEQRTKPASIGSW